MAVNIIMLANIFLSKGAGILFNNLAPIKLPIIPPKATLWAILNFMMSAFK